MYRGGRQPRCVGQGTARMVPLNSLERKSPQCVDPLLGYDVADAGRTSGLSDCGYSDDEIRDLVRPGRFGSIRSACSRLSKTPSRSARCVTRVPAARAVLGCRREAAPERLVPTTRPPECHQAGRRKIVSASASFADKTSTAMRQRVPMRNSRTRSRHLRLRWTSGPSQLSDTCLQSGAAAWIGRFFPPSCNSETIGGGIGPSLGRHPLLAGRKCGRGATWGPPIGVSLISRHTDTVHRCRTSWFHLHLRHRKVAGA
jgi:hypothetical protein